MTGWRVCRAGFHSTLKGPVKQDSNGPSWESRCVALVASQSTEGMQHTLRMVLPAGVLAGLFL